MKSRLIILSDLWGKEKSSWVENYTKGLSSSFQIEYYDSCVLGEIDKSIYTEVNLHQQFVSGGINKAVQKLISLERDKISILGFSVGGIIAWKFGLISECIECLYCISSTRLRHEVLKPNGQINLYFGEKDPYKPSENWFNTMKIDSNIIPGKGHQVYVEEEFADKLTHIIC